MFQDNHQITWIIQTMHQIYICPVKKTRWKPAVMCTHMLLCCHSSHVVLECCYMFTAVFWFLFWNRLTAFFCWQSKVHCVQKRTPSFVKVSLQQWDLPLTINMFIKWMWVDNTQKCKLFIHEQICNGKSYCCNDTFAACPAWKRRERDTFTGIQFTSLLAKNI